METEKSVMIMSDAAARLIVADDGGTVMLTKEHPGMTQPGTGAQGVQQANPGEEEMMLQHKSSLQVPRRKILVGGLKKMPYKPYDKPGKGDQTDNNKERVEWADILDDEDETEQYGLTEHVLQQGQTQTDLRQTKKHKGKLIETVVQSQHQDEIQQQQHHTRATVFPGSILDAMVGGKPCVVVPLIFSVTDGELNVMAAMSNQGDLAIPHFELHEDPMPVSVFREITK